MPTKTKHTPGPWIVDPCQPYVVIPAAIETEKGGYIAEAGGDDFAQQEANARLMAAAPELLEALEAVEAWWFNGETDANVHMPHNVESMIRAAIARAKGVDRG